MQASKVEYGGWANNLQLSNDDVELIVTLDAGPRILSYKTQGGENVFKNYPGQLGGTGESDWQIRGGHRLWLAPESEELTYAPDNGPVPHEIRADSVRVENPADAPWNIRKEMEISLDDHGSTVHILHRATNEGPGSIELATWGLTVMTAGGLEIIPQPPLGEHPRDLAPNRLMAIWPYTELPDPRWRFGSRFITLRQTAHGAPTKLGLAHRLGWVAYLTRTSLFIKEFSYIEGERYPDWGCNFETFSNSDMLEIESLGPLRLLEAGGQISHTEKWHLLGNIPQPDSLKEDAIEEWIEPLLKRAGLAPL